MLCLSCQIELGFVIFLKLVRIGRAETVSPLSAYHHSHLSRRSAGPIHYGSKVGAIAVYLVVQQLMPLARACEGMSDLLGVQMSEGTASGMFKRWRSRVGYGGAAYQSGVDPS